jgi:metallo-beta-lactamase family protein
VSPVLLVGRLLNGDKVVRIFGEEFDVIAEIGSLKSMSAHGDYEDLCQFISCQNIAQVRSLFLYMVNTMCNKIFQNGWKEKGLRM